MSDGTDLVYRIDRMSCTSCKLLITEELEELDGVQSVDVDLVTKQVTVRSTGATDEQIRSTLAEAGYAPASS